MQEHGKWKSNKKHKCYSWELEKYWEKYGAVE